jgi:hypothetical protein
MCVCARARVCVCVRVCMCVGEAPLQSAISRLFIARAVTRGSVDQELKNAAAFPRRRLGFPRVPPLPPSSPIKSGSRKQPESRALDSSESIAHSTRNPASPRADFHPARHNPPLPRHLGALAVSNCTVGSIRALLRWLSYATSRGPRFRELARVGGGQRSHRLPEHWRRSTRSRCLALAFSRLLLLHLQRPSLRRRSSSFLFNGDVERSALVQLPPFPSIGPRSELRT